MTDRLVCLGAIDEVVFRALLRKKSGGHVRRETFLAQECDRLEVQETPQLGLMVQCLLNFPVHANVSINETNC